MQYVQRFVLHSQHLFTQVQEMSAILGVTSPTNSYARLKLLVSQELEFLGSQDRGQDGHGACTSAG